MPQFEQLEEPVVEYAPAEQIPLIALSPDTLQKLPEGHVTQDVAPDPG